VTEQGVLVAIFIDANISRDERRSVHEWKHWFQSWCFLV